MAKAIELVLKTDEKGELHIPRDLLGDTAPGTQLRLRIEAEEPSREKPKWEPRRQSMTPEQRAKEFVEWVQHFKDNDVPGLSAWAVSRDSIYD